MKEIHTFDATLDQSYSPRQVPPRALPRPLLRVPLLLIPGKSLTLYLYRNYRVTRLLWDYILLTSFECSAVCPIRVGQQ